MINLVTGGAGLIGAQLIKSLLKNDEEVICLDNFSTGSRININCFLNKKNFKLLERDVTKEVDINVHKIWHFANPAAPKYYYKNPIQTSNICYLGTSNMLNLAKKNSAKFLFTSTSEIYGNQTKSPIMENSHPIINHFSKRGCYATSKLVAENLCYEYRKLYGIDTKIARIFNTYGPKLPLNDGRVIPNFIQNGILNNSLEINGDGSQTRSFCFVDDLVRGLILLMNSSFPGPTNLGNDEEISMLGLAQKISHKLSLGKEFTFLKRDKCEPLRRKPSISNALESLDWSPLINLDKGLDLTIEFFQNNQHI